MSKQIASIKQTRSLVLAMIKDLSIEQLNQVPEGFSNNIIWNLGHMIAAEQGICYKRAGLPTAAIDEAFFESYKPGTKPERDATEAEVEDIKRLAHSSLEQLEKDYEAGVFANYIPWATRYGTQLDTIDDALGFLPFHEGMHSGYIMALKRVLAYQPA